MAWLELPDWLTMRLEPQSNGCWHWTGHVNPHRGYGYVRPPGSRVQVAVHRLVYELAHGVPLSRSVDVGHACHDADLECVGGLACMHRRCANPDDLVEQTRGENLRAGRGIIAARASQTHCIRGHEFDLKNTHIRPNGTRRCRACDRDRARTKGS